VCDTLCREYREREREREHASACAHTHLVALGSCTQHEMRMRHLAW
jgi:hypothetical protein